MKMNKVAIGIAAMALMASANLRSQTFGFDDITLWYGSGSNQSALVIDWNDGQTPFAIGYRWSAGTPTTRDMLDDILLADARLAFDSVTFIQMITWDGDTDGTFERSGTGNPDPPFTPYWQYLINNETVAAGPPLYDDWEINASLGDPFDGDASDGWQSAPTGTTNRQLYDGSWDAFLFADPASTDKVTENPVSPVPEPLSPLLVLFAAACMLLGRRP